MDITTCPQCGQPATVQWRAVLESTDGPTEHARINCLNRHWFLLPIAVLDRGPALTAHAVLPDYARSGDEH
jgi:hypothetical protein